MKRALLIAGGTVGGLGAVLAITPPQLGSTSAINIAGAPIAGADTTASASASSSSSATTAPATPAAINGTFTGPSVNVNYGNVQVKITVVNGRITDAVAVKAPTGKNDRWTNMAVPILKAQTLKAQSANIQGASGASYTSYGWFTSLQGAIALAGL
jgi:uncharacterized protein with FMN-binding domain